MITYIESEERNPSLDVLFRLADALALELSALIKNAEKAAREEKTLSKKLSPATGER